MKSESLGVLKALKISPDLQELHLEGVPKNHQRSLNTPSRKVS